MPSASRSAYLLTVLAAGACAGQGCGPHWYDRFLTQLRTSSLTIADREVLIGGEWATEIATFEWGLVPVGADRPSSIEAAMCRSGTMSQMDDGCSPARYGTVRPRL